MSSKKYNLKHSPFRRERAPITEGELQRRLSMIPEDKRDFTGRVLGDPLPNDKRRPSCRLMLNVNSVARRLS
jgi:hypothetical protein